MGIDENVGRRTKLTEHAEDFLNIAALLRTGIELSVGISSGTAFAKRVVAFGIYLMLARNKGDVLAAFVYVLSAFQHNGAQSPTQ